MSAFERAFDRLLNLDAMLRSSLAPVAMGEAIRPPAIESIRQILAAQNDVFRQMVHKYQALPLLGQIATLADLREEAALLAVDVEQHPEKTWLAAALAENRVLQANLRTEITRAFVEFLR